MAVVSTPFASGTITSTSGTSVVVSGGAVAGWVGRCIRLRSGAGAGQTRRITAVASATNITIDFPFANTYTRAAMVPFPDVDPAPGDGFVISHLIPDFADGTSVIVDPATLSYRFVGASNFSGGAFVYATNARIDMLSSAITGNQALEDNRVAWRFGDIDAAGNVFNGCHLLDTAAVPSSFGSGTSSAFDPDFEFYGSIGRLTGAGPFWRLHSDNNERVRIIGSRFNGSIGGRMQGSRSIFDEWYVYGNQSVNGPFNAKAAFGAISNIRISQSLQAVYHFWPDSRTLELEGIQLGPGVARGIRFANGGTVAGERLTIKDINIAEWAALPNLYNNANGIYSNNFRIAQYLDASYRNAAGVAVTETTRFVVRDVLPATVYDATVADGLLPRQTLRYRDMVVTAVGNFTWASAGGTTFAPYQAAAVSYLNQPATTNLPLTTSQNVTLLALPDTSVTQADRAVVDAYTEISDLDRLYDRAKAWTCDNLAAANPAFGAQVAVGNGTELDLGGFDLVVDAAAAAPFAVAGNTLTIRASVLGPGATFATLRTTGTLTLLGGASMGISYTTAAGSFAAITVSGLEAGVRVQLYNLTDAVEMANFVAAGTSYGAVFAWPGVRLVRLRVALKGREEFEATAQFLAGGASFAASLPADAVYVANGIDGDTVTEFATDYPNVQVDIDDPDGGTSVQRLYAWHHSARMTENGIREFFGGIVAQDAVNYLVQTEIADLRLDNTGALPVIISGASLTRSDGTSIIAASSGSIQMSPGRAFIAQAGRLDTLPTLAEMQGLAVDVQTMNGAEVIGDGSEADPWRGAGVSP